jgi:hypothetical protein
MMLSHIVIIATTKIIHPQTCGKYFAQNVMKRHEKKKKRPLGLQSFCSPSYLEFSYESQHRKLVDDFFHSAINIFHARLHVAIPQFHFVAESTDYSLYKLRRL